MKQPDQGLGFEHHTEQTGDAEFHAYFYRKEVRQEEKDIPMRPTALTNMPLIDEGLGKIAVQFWDLTWNDEHRYLPYEMRLLLSLTNSVGAGRMRQATRGLVKAYIHGLDSAALDDVFELLAWNHDITLVSLDDKRTQYTDRVEIQAGWKTLFIWLWANMFYAHRQRKWIRLLQER